MAPVGCYVPQLGDKLLYFLEGHMAFVEKCPDAYRPHLDEQEAMTMPPDLPWGNSSVEAARASSPIDAESNSPLGFQQEASSWSKGMDRRVGYGCKVVGVSYEWERLGRNRKKGSAKQQQEALLEDLEKEQKKELAAEERKARAAARAGLDQEAADMANGDTPPRRPTRLAAVPSSGPEAAKEAASPAQTAERQPVLIAWLDKLMLDPIAELFIEQVNDAVAPGYSDVVSQPISLVDIKQRLASGVYAVTGAEGMKPDFDLLFKNCKRYNEEGSSIVDLARKLRDRCSTLCRSEARHRQKADSETKAQEAGGKVAGKVGKPKGSAKFKAKAGAAGIGGKTEGGKRKREQYDSTGGASKTNSKDITDEPKRPPVTVYCRLTLAPAALSICCGGGGKTNPLLEEVKLEPNEIGGGGNATVCDSTVGEGMLSTHVGAPGQDPGQDPGRDPGQDPPPPGDDVGSIDPLGAVGIGSSNGSGGSGSSGGGGGGGSSSSSSSSSSCCCAICSRTVPCPHIRIGFGSSPRMISVAVRRRRSCNNRVLLSSCVS
jgi:hypothetical protein